MSALLAAVAQPSLWQQIAVQISPVLVAAAGGWIAWSQRQARVQILTEIRQLRDEFRHHSHTDDGGIVVRVDK